MTIENSVSNDFYLRSSVVLTFSIAAYPVLGWFWAFLVANSFGVFSRRFKHIYAYVPINKIYVKRNTKRRLIKVCTE